MLEPGQTNSQTDYFFYNGVLIDVNLIISEAQRRCDGSDNHTVAQEYSKLRLASHALNRGDTESVEPEMVTRALERLGRGWMIK